MDTVLSSEKLLQAFCSLPPLAVRLLAQQDTLQTSSEYCVVVLVNAWFRAQPEGSCSAELLRQLSESVRLGQVPRSFHHSITRLPWFRPDADQLCAALTLLDMGLPVATQLSGLPQFPTAWGKGPRAAASLPNHSWAVQEGELRGLLKSAPPMYSSWFPSMGLQWRLVLYMAGRQLSVGVAARAMQAGDIVLCPAPPVVQFSPILCRTNVPVRQAYFGLQPTSATLAPGGPACGVPGAVQCSLGALPHAQQADQLAPWLADGRLTLHAIFSWS